MASLQIELQDPVQNDSFFWLFFKFPPSSRNACDKATMGRKKAGRKFKALPSNKAKQIKRALANCGQTLDVVGVTCSSRVAAAPVRLRQLQSAKQPAKARLIKTLLLALKARLRVMAGRAQMILMVAAMTGSSVVDCSVLVSDCVVSVQPGLLVSRDAEADADFTFTNSIPSTGCRLYDIRLDRITIRDQFSFLENH